MDMPEPELADDKYFYALPQIVRDGFNRTRWYWKNDTKHPVIITLTVKGTYQRLDTGMDITQDPLETPTSKIHDSID